MPVAAETYTITNLGLGGTNCCIIVGAVKHIAAVSIGWHDNVEAARDEIERAIARVSEGRGVLILTDMFGGTPTNITSMFLAEGEVEVVTGVNLPMVIKLASQTEPESLAEVAQRVRDQGHEGTVHGVREGERVVLSPPETLKGGEAVRLADKT